MRDEDNQSQVKYQYVQVVYLLALLEKVRLGIEPVKNSNVRKLDLTGLFF